jgi:hypothetical protein
MKSRLIYFSRLTALCLSLTMLIAVVGCDDDDDDRSANTQPYSISGSANGSQVVPAVSGTGTGTITGSYDPKTRELTYTSNWSGLSGAPTSGGFYTGASGTTGTAIGTPWTFEAGATGTGSNTGTMTLTSEQANQLINGNWYYTYGTTMNPNGEVRGQITAARD